MNNGNLREEKTEKSLFKSKRALILTIPIVFLFAFYFSSISNFMEAQYNFHKEKVLELYSIVKEEFLDKGDLLTVNTKSEESDEAETSSSDDTGFFVEMQPITVNLRKDGRQHRYLKLSVKFEVQDKDHIDVVEHVMPRIRDQFQVFLRELRVEDLEGATGAFRLREELLIRINKVSKPAVVTEVLFDEFLVQ